MGLARSSRRDSRRFAAHHQDGWASRPLTESGFVRVSSNPTVLPSAIGVQDARRVLQSLRAIGRHRFLVDDVSANRRGWTAADRTSAGNQRAPRDPRSTTRSATRHLRRWCSRAWPRRAHRAPQVALRARPRDRVRGIRYPPDRQVACRTSRRVYEPGPTRGPSSAAEGSVSSKVSPTDTLESSVLLIPNEPDHAPRPARWDAGDCLRRIAIARLPAAARLPGRKPLARWWPGFTDKSDRAVRSGQVTCSFSSEPISWTSGKCLIPTPSISPVAGCLAKHGSSR